MTDSMIERVAKAICMANHGPWEHVTDSGKFAYLHEARAAIEAMREVDNHLLVTGLGAFVESVEAIQPKLDNDASEFQRGMKAGQVFHSGYEMRSAWQAMIDAALQHQEPEGE